MYLLPRGARHLSSARPIQEAGMQWCVQRCLGKYGGNGCKVAAISFRACGLLTFCRVLFLFFFSWSNRRSLTPTARRQRYACCGATPAAALLPLKARRLAASGTRAIDLVKATPSALCSSGPLRAHCFSFEFDAADLIRVKPLPRELCET